MRSQRLRSFATSPYSFSRSDLSPQWNPKRPHPPEIEALDRPPDLRAAFDQETLKFVSLQIMQRIRRIGPSLPPGVRLDVFYDRSELVNRTIRTVAKNLAEGALFVVAVLFLLLGSVRGGLIVAAAIYFIVVTSFVCFSCCSSTIK